MCYKLHGIGQKMLRERPRIGAVVNELKLLRQLINKYTESGLTGPKILIALVSYQSREEQTIILAFSVQNLESRSSVNLAVLRKS